jgi:fluoride exporter
MPRDEARGYVLAPLADGFYRYGLGRFVEAFLLVSHMPKQPPPLTHSIDEPDLALSPLKPSDAVARVLRVPMSGHTSRPWRLSVLQTILLIALGAAIGANLRYFVAEWATQTFGTSFPYGTLLINVSGSFLLGVIYTVLLRLDPAYAPALRLLLGVGVLGGYTTFSSFSYETAHLLLGRSIFLGMLNPILSIAGGVISCLLGIGLAELMTGR